MLHAVRRIVVAGLVAALAVAIGGWLLGRARFGASDQQAVARLEAELRQQFLESVGTLGRIAADLAAQRAAINSTDFDQAAPRRLFDAVDAALASQEPGRTGATIYDAAYVPVAWGGRTSELPRSRLEGPSALYVAPDALGPRLVRIEPVLDRSRAQPTRIATIVVEQQLGPARGAPGASDTIVISSTIVPVSLRVRVGDGGPQGPNTFAISAPGAGPLVDAVVSPADLAQARAGWQDGVRAAILGIAALTLLFVAGAMVDLRRRDRRAQHYGAVTAALFVSIGLARVVASLATVLALANDPLRDPVDLLLTACTAVAMVWVALDAIGRWRSAGPRPRLLLGTGESMAWIGLAYFAAGLAATAVIWFYERALRDVVSQSTFDLVQFSLHPLEASRITLTFGLVLLDAAVLWSAVAVTRLPSLWRTRRAFSRRSAAALAWVAGVALGLAAVRARDSTLSTSSLVWALTAVGSGSIAIAHLRRRAGRASQAARLLALFLALFVPSFAMYPSLLAFVTEARERLIATQYGPQARRQREDLQNVLYASLDEIEAMPWLADLVTGQAEAGTEASDRAYRSFQVWAGTDLNVYRPTSAVELYGVDGRLISRFALNLPDYAEPPHQAAACQWAVVDEMSPFGSSQRHVLRASRAICDHATRVGSIVVSVMLDYQTLPFIESQSPYLESLQPDRQLAAEGAFGRDVEFVAYGWSRTPTFTSGTSVWPLTDAVFQRLVESRAEFWTTIERDGVEFRVFFMSDRGGCYALGYPVLTWGKHFVNVAELIFLVGVLYVGMLAGLTLVNAAVSRTPAGGRALLREIRASFYRKLFLAFVLAAVVPVLILAVATRTYFKTQFEAEVKEAAARTATVAQRLVEDYATLQRREGTLAALDDPIMVLVRRAIDQDVNLFERSQLRATSARDLFASRLLPTRTPSDVYRRIVLDRMPTFVSEEDVIAVAAGDSRYLLAAAPVRAGEREGIVTVPITLRRQETERQIDDLDHIVLAAAVLFSLLGAALGYWMAERVADPINRLTRATRRIARGNLDARVAAATSDELGRLIDDFNGMAEDLKRQRSELERTQRLEAWADMARQVAHDIKNPLTPIQLSAEHAQRVNIDRGRPLSPVLEECVGTILSQVRLLRQIAAEFSSFASTATAHPAPTQVGELIEEVVGPYRLGLNGRVPIGVQVPSDLPPLHVDRTLLARALTNVIENALHAMPGTGSLEVVVSHQWASPTPTATAAGAGSLVAQRVAPATDALGVGPGVVPPGTAAVGARTGSAATVSGAHAAARDSVVIEIADTGVGMDPESLARIFEPYFSTKATGTGLGLTIAKRNVELNGGSIAVHSDKGRGTTVTMTFPI
jgi:signal transduction histidine kinase